MIIFDIKVLKLEIYFHHLLFVFSFGKICLGWWDRKALFARNVCICVCVKRQEWVLWQQVMVFTLDVCIFKNVMAKIKGKRRSYV